LRAKQGLSRPRAGKRSTGKGDHFAFFRTVFFSLMLALFLRVYSAPLFAQSPENSSPPTSHAIEPQPSKTPSIAPASGSINGTVIDQDGAVIENAKIMVTSGSFTSQMQSGADGSFNFTNVPSGPFQLSISAPGFAAQSQSGMLQEEQDYLVPEIKLVVATSVEINVSQTREEIAAEQLHVEEKQRVFAVIPNYYVTYVPDAAPLSTKQKFQLGWRFSIDPVSFVITGLIAGAEQANNSFSGYGQGAQGYAKRYGAAYADFVSGTFFGNMLLPAVFKQDPRYFYKGTGSRKSRFFYAVANAVICKGDNGRWQPNYSSVLGSLAAGGLSNLYYPASNRGAGLTFENTAIGLAGSAGSAVVQEFLLRKLTTHAHGQQSQN
jgi:hypothetical protein